MIRRAFPKALLAIILIPCFLFAVSFALSLTPDYPSGVLQAAAWTGQNTPSNSTFLTYWIDSSIIEGWGNRTSYTDSVNTNGTRITDYARFLLSKSGNYSYIRQVRPDYLLVGRTLDSATVKILEEDANETNASIDINGTNLASLYNGKADLPIVYSNNGTIIYGVALLWK